jgi:ribosomal protein S19E (S16A)
VRSVETSTFVALRTEGLVQQNEDGRVCLTDTGRAELRRLEGDD